MTRSTDAHACDGTQPRCLRCAAMARRLATVRAAMTVDDQLDEVTRARMWSRLDDRLLQPPARAFAPGRRAIVALAAVVAAVVALVVTARRHAPDDDVVFVAPAETTLTAPLGPHTRASLVGPARLAIVGVAGDATTVRLDSGALLAAFAGGAGRSLRIEAPGMRVDIVGTLFAVEVQERATCVSVAHGRVRVTLAGRVQEVGSGEHLCTGDDAPAPIEPRVRQALAAHAAITAVREPSDKADAEPVVATAAIEPGPPAPHRDPPPTGRAMPDPDEVTTRARSPEARVDSTPREQPGSDAVASVEVTGVASATDPEPHATGTARVHGGSPREPDAAPPPPPATPAPVAPPPDPAEAHYRAAEVALEHHDPAAADRALAQLVGESPASPLVDQALYDRARIAYQRHAWSEARRHLDALVSRPATSLTEPGRYLTCRIAIELHDGDAAGCIGDYRAAYPDSPHDLDLLGALTQLTHASGGCPAAVALVRELARKYPSSTLASSWRARCPEAP